MGMCLTYTRKGEPADLMRRGVKLFLLGYALNFFRYGIYVLAAGAVSGELLPETVMALFSPDIFQFAGLALFATGIFKKMKLSEIHILIVGLVLSAIGTAIPFIVTGSDALNLLLGLFVFTVEGYANFVFCNWYVFFPRGAAVRYDNPSYRG